jgi:ATP synthase protein I
MWLDTRYDSGVSWTVTGLFTGVILGSLNAWFWIEREGHEDDENEENIG